MIGKYVSKFVTGILRLLPQTRIIMFFVDLPKKLNTIATLISKTVTKVDGVVKGVLKFVTKVETLFTSVDKVVSKVSKIAGKIEKIITGVTTVAEKLLGLFGDSGLVAKSVDKVKGAYNKAFGDKKPKEKESKPEIAKEPEVKPIENKEPVKVEDDVVEVIHKKDPADIASDKKTEINSEPQPCCVPGPCCEKTGEPEGGSGDPASNGGVPAISDVGTPSGNVANKQPASMYDSGNDNTQNNTPNITNNDVAGAGSENKTDGGDEANSSNEKPLGDADQNIDKANKSFTDFVANVENKHQVIKGAFDAMEQPLADAMTKFAETGEMNLSELGANLAKTLKVYAAQKTAHLLMEAAYQGVMTIVNPGGGHGKKALVALKGAAVMGSFVVGSGLGQFHDGIDYVPKTGSYILEKGEAVVQKNTNSKFDKLANNSGGITVNTTIHANDGDSVKRVMPEFEDRVVSIISSNIARNGQVRSAIKEYA